MQINVFRRHWSIVISLPDSGRMLHGVIRSLQIEGVVKHEYGHSEQPIRSGIMERCGAEIG